MPVKHSNPLLQHMTAIKGQLIPMVFGGTRYVVAVNRHGRIISAKCPKRTREFHQLPFGFVDHFYHVNPEFR